MERNALAEQYDLGNTKTDKNWNVDLIFNGSSNVIRPWKVRISIYDDAPDEGDTSVRTLRVAVEEDGGTPDEAFRTAEYRARTL